MSELKQFATMLSARAYCVANKIDASPQLRDGSWWVPTAAQTHQPSEEITTVEADDTSDAVPEYVLVARTPEEMDHSKAKLQTWFGEKLKAEEAHAYELDEAVRKAKHLGASTSGLVSALKRQRDRVQFYGNCLSAVEEGYTLIPNLDISVFAVRIREDRERPYGRGESTWSRRSAAGDVPDVRRDALPAGLGTYVSPRPVVQHHNETKKIDDQHTKVTHVAIARRFRQVEFPIAIGYPMLKEAAEIAIGKRVFDEIGVSPDTRKPADPILIGKVLDRSGHQEMSFLIAWWIDVRAL